MTHELSDIVRSPVSVCAQPHFIVSPDFCNDTTVTRFLQAFEARCQKQPHVMLQTLAQLGANATANTVSMADVHRNGRPQLTAALDGAMSTADIIRAYFTHRFSETHDFDSHTEVQLEVDPQFRQLLRAHKRLHIENRQQQTRGRPRAESQIALSARDAIRRQRLATFLTAVIAYNNPQPDVSTS
jgi:hypothetical protein